jgi:small subunit ribosomal protein S8
MTNYPVGDFLIKIKNAVLVGKKEVAYPTSTFIKSTAHVLKRAGFLEEVNEKEGFLNVKIGFRKKHPLMMGLKLISKPGLRRYLKAGELEKRKGPSLLILSTPKGVMTSHEAIKARLGGEVIAEVW